MSLPRWGIYSVVKASVKDIQTFISFHLNQGAAAIFLYLDAPDDVDRAQISHPLVKIIPMTKEFWENRGGRPDNLETRQFKASRHAIIHAKRPQFALNWISQIDCDEFLIPKSGTITTLLAQVPDHVQTLRVRPIEHLVGSNNPYAFKAIPSDHATRIKLARDIYPTFGPYLDSGFVSHKAGKVFIRLDTSRKQKIRVMIHIVYINDQQDPDQLEWNCVDLGHFHVKPWPEFYDLYQERRQSGSYRKEIADVTKGPAGITLYELLNFIESQEGMQGIEAFFREVCYASPLLLRNLQHHGMLRLYQINFQEIRRGFYKDRARPD